MTNCVTTAAATYVQRRTFTDNKVSLGTGLRMAADTSPLPDKERARCQRRLDSPLRSACHPYRATLAGLWPITLLNAVTCCASLSSIAPGRRVYRLLADVAADLYGSEGRRSTAAIRAQTGAGRPCSYPQPPPDPWRLYLPSLTWVFAGIGAPDGAPTFESCSNFNL